MQADYIRKVNHCYMNFQSEDPFDENSYELKMISANRIPSLLPMTITHIDKTAYLQFDITSLQPFSLFCSSHKIHAGNLTSLFSNLLNSLLYMEDYLLTLDHLFLDPEYLYLNWTTLEFRIAYLPYYECDLITSLQNLMEYLLVYLEKDDRETAILAYRIYHELKEPNCQIGNLRKLLIPENFSEYNRPTDGTADPFTNGTTGAQTTSPFSDHPVEASTGISDIPVLKDSAELTSLSRKILPDKDTWKEALPGIPAAVLIYAVLHIHSIGYLSLLQSVGAILIILVSLISFLWLLRRRPKAESPDIPEISGATSGVSDSTYASSVFAPFPEDERTVLLNDAASSPYSLSSGLQLIPQDKEHHANLPVIELDRENLLLGYQKDICDKMIPDPTVSRIHARIIKEDGKYYLSDLSSRNGTFADDRQLNIQEKVPLHPGMHIRFGGAEYLVQ